jgi:hypothetical protein
MEDIKALTKLIINHDFPEHIKEGLLQGISLEIQDAPPSRYSELVVSIAKIAEVEAKDAD